MVPPRKIAVTHGAPRSSPGSLLLPHRMGLLAGDLLPSHPQVTSSIPRCCHTLSHSSACPRPYGQIDLFGSLKLGRAIKRTEVEAIPVLGKVRKAVEI
ncbi:Os04g0478600 [Oryza sativa Japonica Group]|uniref:Os04g0478600 protein n=1 Tax=Oryza sativa subsp. japonica TaxID=39947 RepID=Q0JCD3_ORYSJ|nr:Os04g0478600 [Oryza sativa Japonica Group]|eukprot:NP_001053090.1 Os04g0478600 [Oryza sativa Japonica Group]